MKEEICRINLKGEKNLPNILSDHFISLISTGILVPGEKLPSELAISRQLNISRIATREAMKILEAKGFIISMGREGKFVNSVFRTSMQDTFRDLLESNRTNISKLYDVKQILDREISVHICKNASNNDLSSMNLLLNRAETAGPEDLRDFYYDFFTAFFSSSKNVFFTHIALEISGRINEYFENNSSSIFNKLLNEKLVFGQIRKIIDGVEKKDVENTRNNIDIHNNYMKKMLLKNTTAEF